MVQYLIAMHNDWFVIALALGLPHYDLENIKRSSIVTGPKGPKRIMVEIIQYWLHRTPDASWEQVVSALELVGHSTLASTIKQQYLLDQPPCECM